MVSFWQGMSELSSTLPSPSADLTIVTVPVHRNGVLAIFNKSSADLSDARHTNNQLTVRVTELQDQCDALTATKQFLDGQVTSLQQACSEYDRKEQDCNVLRVTTRKLEDQLHATQITARNFRSKSQQLQNGLDFALDCNEDYERSIRSKQQDIDALEQQLKALQCTGNTDSSKLDTPKQSLQNAQAQLTELHLSTKTQGIHIAKLEADRISDQELLHDRNLQLDTHRHSITVSCWTSRTSTPSSSSNSKTSRRSVTACTLSFSKIVRVSRRRSRPKMLLIRPWMQSSRSMKKGLLGRLRCGRKRLPI
jgi:predicted  nucleic acid-binding Zn-ribbon protein